MVADASNKKNLPEMPIPKNSITRETPENQTFVGDIFVPQAQEQTQRPPEIVPQIEQVSETQARGEVEKKLDLEEDQTLESRIKSLTQKLRRKKKKQIQIPIIKDELTVRIEKVMEDGLGDAFLALTPIQKQEFKIKGEETAWQIRQLLKKTHIKIKEIFRLMYEWLKILPGINKFFLEQEAKIKADKILSLKDYHQDK